MPGGDLAGAADHGSAELTDLEWEVGVLEVVAEPGYELDGEVRVVMS